MIRAARPDDLEGLYGLALAAGSGMTNLPPDRDVLAAKLAGSAAAMESSEARAKGLPLLFVVERFEDGAPTGDPIVGSACILARIGVEWPFYSYRMTRQVQSCKSLGKSVAHDILILANDFDGAAEVGGLFIDRGCRGAAAGRLAARSRYLFIAQHRNWFDRRLIAEMRGYQDENGESPVWNALGREFYGLEFGEADRISATAGSQFIADLAPKHPVYTSLLRKSARQALGRPHDDSRRALELLLEEGFRFEGYIDIFDGGPTLFAEIDELKAVRESHHVRVERLSDRVDGDDRLISAGLGPDFRAMRGGVQFGDHGGVILAETLARALGVGAGDWVRHVHF